MKFTWHTDKYVLIHQWSTSTTKELLTAMALSCALAVTMEYLRQVMSSRSRRQGKVRQKMSFLVCQSILYLMSVLIGNLLMLVVMTGNLWLLFSIMCGAGIGFFIIRPVFNDELVNNNEHVSYEKGRVVASEHSTDDSALLEGQNNDVKMKFTHTSNSNSSVENSHLLPGENVLARQRVGNDDNFVNKTDMKHLNGEDVVDINDILDSSPFKMKKNSKQVEYVWECNVAPSTPKKQ